MKNNRLAILGGRPVRKKSFPSWPIHGKREKELLLEVLESGRWWYGEKVREFEERFASYQGAKYGITTVNGTVALEIALIVSGIGAGSEVIIPSYSFVATASAVLKANAVPVFVDIDIDTFNIDIDAVKDAITPKTRAIVPVHFAGLPVEMDRLVAVARKHSLKVIEDAAHGWGSKYRGKGVGTIGDAGIFSFQHSKNITSGEGGIILTNDKKLADDARSYSNCGRGMNGPWYEHYLLGGNYRMTEFHAALLLAQLEKLGGQNRIRERNAKILNTELSRIEGIKILKGNPNVRSRTYHLYCFRFKSQEFGGLARERFLEALQAEGIPCRPGYPYPIYRNPLFLKRGSGPEYCPVSCHYYGKDVDYSKVVCPQAEEACREAVWIPQNLLLGNEGDMKDIVKAIRKIRDNVDEL